jgi:hypothetical protein
MRGALAAVQKALSRHRYFLRTMPVRGEIDLSRRLTGDLSTAASARWPANDQTPDARLARVRALLADLASLAGALEFARDNGGNASASPALASSAAAAAARVLALDPTSASLQNASTALTQASQSLAKRNTAVDASTARESLALVRKAAAAVLPLARPGATANAQSSAPAPTASEPALRGAVVDALRAPGGSR